jgi:hypothetical protein
MKPTPVSTNKGVSPNQNIFGSWSQASSADFLTRQLWLENRRSVRKTEKALAILDDGERQFQLFSRDQTVPLRSDLADRWELIARFVKYTDLFGFLPRDAKHPIQWPTKEVPGGVKPLIYSSWDYRNRIKGVRVSARWAKKRADKFYVRAASQTNWFVFDLDNHTPTSDSLAAHLKLLQHLVHNMAGLQPIFGPLSIFYDYQQDAPRGVHIWVCLQKRRSTKEIHSKARQFLESISNPELDKELARCRLKRIGELEILPSENQLMQFFGSAGREVFTKERLLPQNEAFDATSLLHYIHEWDLGGDPTNRYGSLAALALDQPYMPISIPVVEVDPQIELCSSSTPSKENNYFTNLLDLCLRGVLVPDNLFAGCIRHIVTALWFRDLFAHPEKKALINNYLLEWIVAKHNNNVTRVKNGNVGSLSRQVSHAVKNIYNTPQSIQDYWQKVRMNDKRYPRRTLSLIEAMKAKVDCRVVISKMSIKETREYLGGKAGSGKGNIYTHCIGGHFVPPQSTPPLPPPVLEQLEKGLLSNNQRKGLTYDRKLKFCKEFLYLIGPEGFKRVHHNTLNQIGGYKLNTQPKTLRRYKALLVKANILKPGSSQKLERHKSSSLYELHDWVVEAWKQSPASLPDSHRKRSKAPSALKATTEPSRESKRLKSDFRRPGGNESPSSSAPPATNHHPVHPTKPSDDPVIQRAVVQGAET